MDTKNMKSVQRNPEPGSEGFIAMRRGLTNQEKRELAFRLVDDPRTPSGLLSYIEDQHWKDRELMEKLRRHPSYEPKPESLRRIME
ncbi:MAG: hypothetical protein ABSE71_04375 [Candidatus Micrarchaeaceae archaeon]|jgi:hypothetical protein|nr:hypothetical protein [Candidatus Micrarchaeota archaeon]HII09764.1 hypothetical protein [Candidatus Micrarchaeota archaeon]